MKLSTIDLGCKLQDRNDIITIENPKDVKIEDDKITLDYVAPSKYIIDTLKELNATQSDIVFIVYDDVTMVELLLLTTKLKEIITDVAYASLEFEVTLRVPILIN